MKRGSAAGPKPLLLVLLAQCLGQCVKTNEASSHLGKKPSGKHRCCQSHSLQLNGAAPTCWPHKMEQSPDHFINHLCLPAAAAALSSDNRSGCFLNNPESVERLQLTNRRHSSLFDGLLSRLCASCFSKQCESVSFCDLTAFSSTFLQGFSSFNASPLCLLSSPFSLCRVTCSAHVTSVKGGLGVPTACSSEGPRPPESFCL